MIIDLILPNPNLNSINILSNLNKFMYLKPNKLQITKQPNIFEIQKPNTEDKEEIEVQNNDIINPTQKNSLFWCIFISNYGYNEYLKVDRNYGAKEIEIKQKISLFLTENKKYMSNSNYKMSQIKLKEITSDLLTNYTETNYNMLFAFSAYFKINYYIMHPNNKYIIKISGNKDNNQSYLLYLDNYKKYSILLSEVNEEKLKEKYFFIDNYLKPIKSINNYKLDDLINFCKKLNIEYQNKKYKKKELYDLIYNSVSWY
tara:strand:- start:9702 stop:10475 length:774 start_codon:yes stop_codon:yes gene_type:complete